MSAKISAARRAAFLKALEETGNQTLAAERAKVSRSWVVLHRSRDAGFDAAVRAAVRRARERLRVRPSTSLGTSGDGLHGKRGSNAPPSGWGFLDGEELVVRGTNGRRTQIARARMRQWTPRVEDRFLATLSATCNVKAACAEVGMTAASAYGHRKRWTAFARRWDAAVEEGYARLLLGLVEHAGNPFSSPELPEPAPTPRLSLDDTLHNLFMHQHEVDGLGDRPGLPRHRCSFDEAAARVMRAVDAIEGGKRFSEEEKARDREQWALRRGAGQARRRRQGSP